jgi:lysophospholipase L1-like esterase
MKRLLTAIACLFSVTGFAQQNYFTTTPSGYSTRSLSFLSKTATPDSTSDYAFFNQSTGKYFTFYSGVKIQGLINGLTAAGLTYKLKSDTTAATGYVRNWYLTNQLASYLKFSDTSSLLSNLVHKTGTETINGLKTATNNWTWSGGGYFNTITSAYEYLYDAGNNRSLTVRPNSIQYNDGSFATGINFTTPTASNSISVPNNSGTFALTNDTTVFRSVANSMSLAQLNTNYIRNNASTAENKRIYVSQSIRTDSAIYLHGSNGSGYIDMPYLNNDDSGGNAVATPSSGIRVYSNGNNKFGWKGTNGFTVAFLSQFIGGNIAYSLPATNGATLGTTNGNQTYTSAKLSPAIIYQTPAGTAGTDSIAVKSALGLRAIPASYYANADSTLHPNKNLSDVTNKATALANIGGTPLIGWSINTQQPNAGNSANFNKTAGTYSSTGLTLNGGDGSFNYYIELLNYTALEDMEIGAASFKSTVDGAGIGLGIDCAGTAYIDAKLDLTGGANRGKLYISIDKSTFSIVSTNALSFTTGTDYLTIKARRTKFAVVFTAINNTTGQQVSVEYNLTDASPSGQPLMRYGRPIVFTYGGTQVFDATSSIYENSYVEKNIKLLEGGASIGVGYAATNYLGRHFNLNGEAKFDYSVYASASATTSDFINLLPEILAVHPEYLYLEILTNDALGVGGATVASAEANLNTIVAACTANGIKLILAKEIPNANSTANTKINTLNTYVDAMPGVFKVVDLNTILGGPGVLAAPYDYGDGTHPSDYAQGLMAQQNIASLRDVLLFDDGRKYYNFLNTSQYSPVGVGTMSLINNIPTIQTLAGQRNIFTANTSNGIQPTDVSTSTLEVSGASTFGDNTGALNNGYYYLTGQAQNNFYQNNTLFYSQGVRGTTSGTRTWFVNDGVSGNDRIVLNSAGVQFLNGTFNQSGGLATFGSSVNLSGLTASQVIGLDASKNIINYSAASLKTYAGYYTSGDAASLASLNITGINSSFNIGGGTAQQNIFIKSGTTVGQAGQFIFQKNGTNDFSFGSRINSGSAAEYFIRDEGNSVDRLVLSRTGAFTLTGTLTSSGALTAPSFVTSGGTSAQNVKGDGTLGIAPLSNSYTAAAAAQTTFTVTIGVTEPGTTYKVQITPTSSLAAALYYVNNKTTTTFDVVYASPLTGTESFDWTVLQ